MDDRPEPRLRPFVPPPDGPRVRRIAHQLRTCRASWIYGLWHRETLVAAQNRVLDAYANPWGWDYLAMLPLILDGAVAGTRQTWFEQRIFRAGTTLEARRARLPSLSDWQEIRPRFAGLCREFVAERSFTPVERALLKLPLDGFVERACISRWRLLAARLGLSRHASRG